MNRSVQRASGIAALILIAALLALFIPGKQKPAPQPPAAPQIRVTPPRQSTTPRQPPATPPFTPEGPAETITPQPAPIQVTSIGDLYHTANGLLTRHEAARSTLLLTAKRDGRTSYLIGIPKPTPDEVKAIRAEIADLQRQVPAEYKQKLDQMLQELIKSYDPFGVDGQRCVLIHVPDQAGGRVHGMSFSSDDFVSDVKMVTSGNLSVRDARHFVRGDGLIPERFNALLK